MSNASRPLTTESGFHHVQRDISPAGERDELEHTRTALVSEMQRATRLEQLCQELRRRSLRAREEEQRRLARELHDQVGQTLTALKLAISASRRAVLQTDVVAARLTDAEHACFELERGLAEVRERLRPAALDDLGLRAAIEQLAHTWQRQHGIEVDLVTAGLSESLTPDVETTLYRVVQESLTNIARHASAKHVSVVLQCTALHAIVSIEDDGVGFDVNVPHPGHCGLVGMRERLALCHGTLDVWSEPGRGASIVARLPLADIERVDAEEG